MENLFKTALDTNINRTVKRGQGRKTKARENMQLYVKRGKTCNYLSRAGKQKRGKNMKVHFKRSKTYNSLFSAGS